MLNRILMVGLLAGLVAGLAVAVLQHFVTTPLILVAETYEHAEGPAGPSASAVGMIGGAPLLLAHGGGHAAEGAEANEAWAPADGIERTLFAGFATVLAAIGFALILIAGMTAAGDEITVNRAVAWALAAFVATGLVPAIGLAPELPASAAGPLVARQLWWGGTAVAAAVSLWLFLRVERAWAKPLAVLLLVVPFLIGAPHPDAFESKVPAELAGAFAARSLALQALLWIAAGWAVAVFWQRFARRDAA